MVESMIGENAGVGVEDVAGRAAGPQGGFAGEQRIARRAVVGEVGRLGVADNHGAHDGRVVPPEGARELEGDLVAGVKGAPAGLVAAEQRVAAGADDELVARIVAPGPEDGGVLGGEDVALVGSGADQRDRRAIRGVGELASPADVGDLLLGFSGPQARDEAGGVEEVGGALEGGVQLLPVRGDEPVALVLDAEALA